MGHFGSFLSNFFLVQLQVPSAKAQRFARWGRQPALHRAALLPQTMAVSSRHSARLGSIWGHVIGVELASSGRSVWTIKVRHLND